MKSLFFLMFLVFALLAGLTSCSKDDDTEGAKAIKYLDNDINGDVVFYADTIYVIKNTVVVSGQLTVRPGTVVKFTANGGLSFVSIVAVGTKSHPIVFTSIYDDKHGGDTDGDNGLIEPKVGDWGFWGNDKGCLSLRLGYCEVYYNNSSLLFSYSFIDVQHCVFAHSKSQHPDYTSSLMIAANNIDASIFKSNCFYDNYLPLTISSRLSVDDSNAFSYNGVGNTLPYIAVLNILGDISSPVVWSQNEVPFVIFKDVTIENTGSLEFADGVVVKFQSGRKMTAPNENFLNKNNKNVVFTSFTDDSQGGDTNIDQNATTPASGYWEGIYYSGTSTWFNGNSYSTVLYDNH